MELVEGESLKGPLPVETALNYARQLVQALEYAHDRGVMHRDLKPANIKATTDTTAAVADQGTTVVPEKASSRKAACSTRGGPKRASSAAC